MKRLLGGAVVLMQRLNFERCILLAHVFGIRGICFEPQKL